MADPTSLPDLVFRIPMAIGGLCAILVLMEAWNAARHPSGVDRVDLALRGYLWFDSDNFDETGRAHLRRMWMYALGVFGSGMLFVVLAVAWTTFAG